MSESTLVPDSAASVGSARYRAVRRRTEAIAAPLAIEDHVVQTIADVSPPKWHLAHTTWFFETFVLARFSPGWRAYDPGFGFLFNSYYEAVGARTERASRGTLSRPTVEEVRRYRAAIDDAMVAFLDGAGTPTAGLAEVLELGLNHEEQHQELLLTDLKHILASNPSRPAYRQRREPVSRREARSARWIEFAGGLVEVGHDGAGFAFDNEGPRHRVWLEPFALADRPVTNGEFLEFVEDGGYRRPELWLSDGWAAVQRLQWNGPLYWETVDGKRCETTLHGRHELELDLPVVHVSHFEADAYARWRGARLPTEFEWEHAAERTGVERALAEANLFDGGEVHVRTAPRDASGLAQLFGDVWEWTASAYLPYPGFRALPGALGEYNGKFMSGQLVLRGGSIATPRGHVRASYRNFFQPEKRWQFTGLRLARERSAR
ncbi:MAG: ergothioneine biosynthesis protein EgtB [Planctomycetes bacterium]|nr:ergothioneine biosynthesis protein EgtB [Planctomycetota bacterium]